MAIRKDLTRAIHNRAGLTLRESALCTEALTDWITETLSSGRRIELRGLGIFEIKRVSEKNYPSSFSNKTAIPAHSKIVFRPCEKLKAAVRELKA